MNRIEQLRRYSINNLFQLPTFSKSWDAWIPEISRFAPTPTSREIFDLGDHLREIFMTTNSAGRTQSGLSAGGTCWEALVCWYLNLCLMNTRTVVLKNKNALIPKMIQDAISVNYGTFKSNTESDLIAITYPDVDFFTEEVTASSLGEIISSIEERFASNLIALIDIHIIQCKTNWNDNAQIPMLWDIVYSSTGFKPEVVTIGKNGSTIKDAGKFSYSFVTVPTTNPNKIKMESTPVLRLKNLSGGNYWGMSSKQGVADSIKEIINHNFFNNSCLKTINIEKLKSNNYFNFPLR